MKQREDWVGPLEALTRDGKHYTHPTISGFVRFNGFNADLKMACTYLVVTILSSVMTMQERNAADTPVQPPAFGELLICLIVPTPKQQDRLGDLEEIFSTVWVPKFGARIAKLVYIAQTLRSCAGIIRVTLVGAVLDRILRVFAG